MFVKIGKYPDSKIICQLLDNYLYKKYGTKWTHIEYTKFEKFLENIDGFIQAVYDATINKFIGKRKRKIIVKIDPYDVWNMDNTLAYIILPMLKKLKEEKQGSPYVDDEDVPDNMKSTSADPKKNDWDTDSNHFKRWDYVLDEMIFAFESQFNDWENNFTSGKMDRIFVPIDKDGNEVSKENADKYRWDKGPNDTYKVDTDGLKAYGDRISKGYTLFGKYYSALWT